MPDHPLALGDVEALLEHAGEAVEVDGLLVGGLGRRHQVVEVVVAEVEPLLEEGAEPGALVVADHAVDRGDMDRGGRLRRAGLRPRRSASAPVRRSGP